MTQPFDPYAPPSGSTPPAGPQPGPAPTGPMPPLHQTYGAPPPQLPQPPQLRSAAGLGTASIVLASVWTATEVLGLLLAPQAAEALREAGEAGVSAVDSTFTGYDAMTLLSGLVQLAAYVVTCLWLYQSRSTAVAANPTFRHQRGPVWVWLGWMVPVVAFWFPFQVVRDVRRATSRGPVSGIGGWWAAWLVFFGASNLVGRLVASSSEDSASSAADALVGLEGVATLACIVALVLWIRIIRDVTRAQGERIAAARGGYAS
ncbi:DUF4328 domain-containing protein [Promicromonospora sp. NPDC057488]|uniref:DUF4328 domain-containing protein n=1 Tax=Promicromonospora sp. NPDC057488 TaxID=3346147 RepID=UPI00366ADEA8